MGGGNIGQAFYDDSSEEKDRVCICNATITRCSKRYRSKRALFSFCLVGGGSIEEKSREVIEKERFCQNTGYTGEDWVEIGMRGDRGGGRRDGSGSGGGGGDGSRYISTAMRYGFS